jgi:hypothetical protein
MLRGLAFITGTEDFIIKNQQVQIIKLNIPKESIEKYIGAFDISICKNYYDGKELHSYKMMHIEKKEMVLYRYKYPNGQIADTLFNDRSTQRVKKYQERGYTLKKEIYVIVD